MVIYLETLIIMSLIIWFGYKYDTDRKYKNVVNSHLRRFGGKFDKTKNESNK